MDLNQKQDRLTSLLPPREYTELFIGEPVAMSRNEVMTGTDEILSADWSELLMDPNICGLWPDEVIEEDICELGEVMFRRGEDCVEY